MNVNTILVRNAIASQRGRCVCNFTLPGDWPGLKSILTSNLTRPDEFNPLLFKGNLECGRDVIQYYAPRGIGGTLSNLARKLVDRAEKIGTGQNLCGKVYYYLPKSDPMVQELKRAVDSMTATQNPDAVRTGSRDARRRRDREFAAGMRSLEKRDPYWRD